MSSDLTASFDYLEALYRRPILPPKQAGLRRIECLLDCLGSPQRQFPSVHVTGTCGKGSTVTMIGSILSASGLKTGVFRSPHMDTYRERIVIDDAIVDSEAWLAAFSAVRRVSDDMESGRVAGYDLGRISLFEMVWAMAAWHFAKNTVDIAVVEVGIGGRLSPTNVLEPECAVLTNVSLDHTGFLGPTEVDIAREKSQIIKPNSSATSAVTQAEVIKVVRNRADETGAQLWLVGEDVGYEIDSQTLKGETFSVTTPRQRHDDLALGLLGRHQVINAATAVSAIDQLSERGFEITGGAVAAGLSSARFPGRFEILSTNPTIVLDGARNVASARVLADAVTDLFPDRRIGLLIGVLGDKDAQGIGEILAPLATWAMVTQPPWEGREGDPSTLIESLRRHLDLVGYDENVDSALNDTLDRTGADDVLVVTGSLYLVATVRNRLLRSTRLTAVNPTAIPA